MRVLITGGTGFLGRSTVQALVGAGQEVRAIGRDAARAAGAWPSGAVEVVEGQVGDPRVVGSASQGMDAVVHAAATFSYVRGGGSSMTANAAVARTILEA